jgi:hypothetical protein
VIGIGYYAFPLTPDLNQVSNLINTAIKITLPVYLILITLTNKHRLNISPKLFWPTQIIFLSLVAFLLYLIPLFTGYAPQPPPPHPSN